MTLSALDTNINWEQFTSMRTFESMNVVFRLTNPAGESLFVKFLPPGEGFRSKFATEIIEGAGLKSYKCRVVKPQDSAPGSEWKRITDKVDSLAPGNRGNPRRDKFDTIKDNFEILIMEDVKEAGNLSSFHKVRSDKGNQILTLMNRAEFIHDVGRMIAADIILGNYDRISYVHSQYEDSKQPDNAASKFVMKESATKFHPKNFLVDPDTGHIVPIDNDATLRSMRHHPNALFQLKLWVNFTAKSECRITLTLIRPTILSETKH